MTKTSIVPCNGCKLCCQRDSIILHPEHGDDATLYQTVDIVHPMTGHKAKMLDHKSNGDCIYLGEKGCEIYEKRPVICREFDCRGMYLSLTKAQRKQLVDDNLAEKEMFDAGKARLHTLTYEDKQLLRTKRNDRIKNN